MPRGLARSEPIGLWRVGASAAERVQAARTWAARLLHGVIQSPPFHGEKPAAAGGLS
ncbi:MAG TPA: hypothetical protein VFF76_07310 [Holophagaceae bacterium]|jgi:hypothetical protein|nr:hypothetical protein [Holophagaceae bacterium]